ncbi:Heterokaryon incompatibility protein 6, OR allele [Pseudocercospora fuligena]|uniref:Heterokaryon incompatibility protein 6, OR allele n=1 Tax=Pseudocercospora fuligena TaxID=685502 RepID=A0A8H6RMI4_9PEZI|nr:Heterokaryon incompatibility protein 6, OR allele [Pseudocercospora fuligena]
MSSTSEIRVDSNKDDVNPLCLAVSSQERATLASDSNDRAEGKELEFDEWNEQALTEPELVKDLTACYVCAPLEQPRDIRLAILHSDTSSENGLCIELQSMSLDRLVPYYAVSYAWGKQHRDNSHLTHSIKCGAHSFSVSAHLHAALKRIHEAETLHHADNLCPRTPLWIDALCINQADNQERSRQVRMMDEIYSGAESTIIWLGEEDFEGEFGGIQELQELQGLPTQYRFFSGNFTLNETVDNMARSRVDVRKQCSRLLERDWFYRRWTLQEYILSCNTFFLIGKTCLQPRFVLKLAQATDSITVPAVLAEKKTARRLLLDNLLAFRHSKCTDFHDYVYALLGISQDGPGIDVDYSNPAEDLFTEVARQHIAPRPHGNPPHRSNRLTAVLRMAMSSGHVHNTEWPVLPSWVPDWSGRTWSETENLEISLMLEGGKYDSKHLRRIHDSFQSACISDIHIEGKTLLLSVVMLDVTRLSVWCAELIRRIDAPWSSCNCAHGCHGLEEFEQRHLRSTRERIAYLSEDMKAMNLKVDQTAFVLPGHHMCFTVTPAHGNKLESISSDRPTFSLIGYRDMNLGAVLSRNNLDIMSRLMDDCVHAAKRLSHRGEEWKQVRLLLHSSDTDWPKLTEIALV